MRLGIGVDFSGWVKKWKTVEEVRKDTLKDTKTKSAEFIKKFLK